MEGIYWFHYIIISHKDTKSIKYKAIEFNVLTELKMHIHVLHLFVHEILQEQQDK
jgi:hypothetical protein